MTPEAHALLSALLPALFPNASPTARGAGLERLRDHGDLAAVSAACACALAGDDPRRMHRYRLAHPILVTGPAAGRTPGPPATQGSRYAAHIRRRLARAKERADEQTPTTTDRKDQHR
jgi:hypothetical protein